MAWYCGIRAFEVIEILQGYRIDYSDVVHKIT
jgi:hypothetical protein